MQNTPRVARWLFLEYPRIVARAKQEKAEIYWVNETGLQACANVELGYAPRGKTPRVRIPAKRKRVNKISAITNQGKMWFMFYRDTMNSQRLINFMQLLVRDAGRKVFLILDNVRVHHSEAVKTWLEKNREQFEVFYLPPASPELNSDEYLNGTEGPRSLRSASTERARPGKESQRTLNNNQPRSRVSSVIHMYYMQVIALFSCRSNMYPADEAPRALILRNPR